MKPMDVLQQLQAWYTRQCDGDWEHQQGITIQSLDNPGWLVKVDLVGTDLIERPFNLVMEPVDAQGFQQSDRWLHCDVKDGVWHGAGDETKLGRILEAFITWANHGSSPPRDNGTEGKS